MVDYCFTSWTRTWTFALAKERMWEQKSVRDKQCGLIGTGEKSTIPPQVPHKRHKKYRLEGIHMLRVGRRCQIKGAEGSVAGSLTPESSDWKSSKTTTISQYFNRREGCLWFWTNKCNISCENICRRWYINISSRTLVGCCIDGHLSPEAWWRTTPFSIRSFQDGMESFGTIIWQ